MSKVTLTQRNSAKIGSGEKRELTFLANTGTKMADGTTIDLQTLQVRDPDSGELVFVKDLNESDSKNYVALLTDHMWSVDAKIGQVRKLWLTDDGLMAGATLANTDEGNKALQLAKDDMLDTFSVTIGLTEEPGEDGVIHNSQILEISAVWLGNDEKTKLISVNERKETSMEVKSNTLTADEAKALQDKVADLEDAIKGLTEGAGDAADKAPADEPTPSENEKADEKVEQNSREAVSKNSREAKQFAQPVHQVSVKSNAKAWLDSDASLRAFRNAIVKFHGRNQAHLAWDEYAREAKRNGLTGDAIVPTSIMQIFFKGWTDDTSILSTFRQANTKSLQLSAWTTADDETGRALGHKKGDVKAEQTLTRQTRQVTALPIYKKLGLYIMEIFNDDSGETLRFRSQELADRVLNEVARGAIIGDGRTAPESSKPDYRVFRDNMGLFSMADDIAGNSAYQNIVANEIKATDGGTTLYEKVRKALNAVRSDNGRKVVVLPEGGIDEILNTADTNNRPIYPLGANVELAFPNVKFYECEWFNGSKYATIAYADQSYALIGERTPKVYTDFDLNTNTDIMMVERIVGGSLYGRKAAAGVLKS